MHPSKVLFSFIVGIALSASSSAQIYESKDAQGNTVYSDKPSHGAEAVKLAPTNSADPVAERPMPPSDTADESTERSTQSADEDLDEHGYQHDSDHANGEDAYYGGTYNNNDDPDSRSERRQNGDSDRPGSDRPQVNPLDSGSRATTGVGVGGGARARGR